MHLRQPSSGVGLDACCTCMAFLADIPDYDTINTTNTGAADAPADINDEKASMFETTTEKPLPPPRQLECCSRYICGRCLRRNDRFAVYCPYCQISQAPSSLPPGLKEPPSYDTAVAGSSGATRKHQHQHRHHPSPTDDDSKAEPPPYTPSSTVIAPQEKAASAADIDDNDENENDYSDPPPDTLHFLNHEHDTLPSLSLRYGVPLGALRASNNLHSDHLLLGRRTIVIPGRYYRSGVSLSPRPIEGEEEEKRKGKIRRWMVACKVHEYDVAVLYLEQSGYDLESATEAYFADEKWERENPVVDGEGVKGKGKAAATKGKTGSGNSGWRIGGLGLGKRNAK